MKDSEVQAAEPAGTMSRITSREDDSPRLHDEQSPRRSEGEQEEREDEEAHFDPPALETIRTHHEPPPDAEKATLQGDAAPNSLDLTRTGTHLSRLASRLTTRDLPDPGPPPDGGVKAWLQVAMAFALTSSTWGYVNSFGVFQTYYTSTLGEGQSTVSWVGSLQLWVLFFMSAFSGRALDAGLYTPTLWVGSAIQLLGIFMNSLCTNLWQLLLAQGLCTGIGSGIIFCPTLGLVTTYFSKHKGIAVAIVTSGNSFGGAIYPVVVRYLLHSIGFAWTVRVIGFINLALLAMCIAFLRPRLPPRKSGPIFELAAFREIPYLSAVSGFTLVFGAMFFAYYYVGSYGRNILNMSYASSTTLVILFNGIGIPARLLTGWFADTFTGPLNLIIPLLALNALLAFTWLAVHSIGGLYVEAACYGLAAGAYQCLFPTTITSLNADLSKNGTRLGMAFSLFSFAGLLGPPIGGALLTTNGGGRGGYVSALVGVGVATLVGTGLLCVARVKKAGWGVVKC